MFPAIFSVFLDANVLFPMAVRDTLLRAAEAGLVQPYWSARVLEEMRRNLVTQGRCSEQKAEKLVAIINRVFPDSTVIGYEHLEPAMKNDPGDRHVVAAALMAHAQVIVTNNLKHFRKEDLPPSMKAQSADDFLQHLFDLSPRKMLEVLRKQAADKQKPRCTLEELLDGLARSVPGFVKDVRDYLALRDAEPSGSA
ncbi:PIN domain-containing protein [Melittangium boletus]|uniref:PIN domain-containing protein n=1 Tax=Melittangium boletus DSM 14713 TaxID=1294270 RepID=A0A250IHQ0_9BACT|nr:PIN domain-containing protein [Melittangium boletus]ATB30750.1 PIN domain-containing protein [Melittangium boletus DSM 14713]